MFFFLASHLHPLRTWSNYKVLASGCGPSLYTMKVQRFLESTYDMLAHLTVRLLRYTYKIKLMLFPKIYSTNSLVIGIFCNYIQTLQPFITCLKFEIKNSQVFLRGASVSSKILGLFIFLKFIIYIRLLKWLVPSILYILLDWKINSKLMGIGSRLFLTFSFSSIIFLVVSISFEFQHYP